MSHMWRPGPGTPLVVVAIAALLSMPNGMTPSITSSPSSRRHSSAKTSPAPSASYTPYRFAVPNVEDGYCYCTELSKKIYCISSGIDDPNTLTESIPKRRLPPLRYRQEQLPDV
ncbi:hypothetical protein K438DRAFT_1999224 [Mycena galopus ATCC 62051]|nr:hypothetical protein K438DRAFT_1999224 [Mycena galopus ATCC 62051]